MHVVNKWKFTKDEKYIKQWNKFVSSVEDSSFLQKTHRLYSYKKHRCSFELQVIIDDQDNIIAGSANLIIAYPIFKIYICSYGPLVANSNFGIVDLSQYASQFLQRAQNLNCFMAQLSLPLSLKNDIQLDGLRAGICFQKIAIQNKLNLIALEDENCNSKSKEKLIAEFSANGRRDVRASYRKGLTSRVVSTEEEMKIAYECIITNAKTKGYVVRPWEDIGSHLTNGFKNGDVHLLTAVNQDKIVGAIVLEKSGNTLNYTIGGVQRSTPDLHTGYFLQIEGMLHAIECGMKYYNISYGGPREVMRFKSQFNPVLKDSAVHYYSVNKILLYSVYKILINVYNSKYFRMIFKIFN